MPLVPKQITKADKWCQVEYATICPFSAQNKWLLLQDGRGYYAFHNGEGAFVKMPLLIGHNLEPRWDATDPDIFYYLTGNTIQSFNATTTQSKMIHIFNEYIMFAPGDRNGVQGLGEGDTENNKWALAGMRRDGKRDVFLYDLTARKKGGVLELEPDVSVPETFKKSGRVHGLDNVYCTPSGNVQIGWYASGKDRFQGVELYDRDMNFIRQLATVMSHNDVASYQGKDILIWGSSADPEINKNALFAIDNTTGDKRPLLDLPWAYAYHVSACARDFAIVGTYAPDNSLPSQILKVKLDGSGHEVLCDTGSVMMDENTGTAMKKGVPGKMAYTPTPRCAVTRGGEVAVFNSNGGDVSRGVNYVDVFLLALEESKPAPPPPPPKPEPIVVTPSPDLHMELDALRRQLMDTRAVTAAYIRDLQQKNEALEKQVSLFQAALVDPHPDPDLWPTIDFLRRGHLPGQRWGFELQDNGKHRMFDVMNGEWMPIEIPAGNQYLFVQTPDGIEQRERKTNKK